MMRSMLLLAVAATASAQAVVGTAYGFAAGVTGGGSVAGVAPSSAEELAEWLSDDTARTILIDQEYDFTGTSATGSGCDRKSCSSSNGGQLYLGDLSCGGDDNVAVSSITYDAAGTAPLAVGSNKSIISSNGQGVIKGKGLQFQSGASNIIVQGIHFTDINPGIVWGGDALDFKGNNDGVWVDHCKISLVGRMFIVSHYDGSRITISNNEFDGVTSTSASCNGNHYWTMMFIADGDQVTLDRNYFHDVSGRAPKLGDGKVSSTFQATNNYFSNMKGHAFDAYAGVTALIEGNVFEGVSTPMTDVTAAVSTIYDVPDAGSACESSLGRACAANTADSSSGEIPALSGTSAIDAWANLKDYIVTPVAASEVASLVSAGAGPANLGSSSGATPVEEETTPVEETPVEESPVETPVEEPVEAPATETPIAETPVTETPVEEPAEDEEEDDEEDVNEGCSTQETPAEETPVEETPVEEPATGNDDSNAADGEVQQWGQCGGSLYTGSTKCVSGTSCVAYNDYYSQCVGSSKRSMRRAQRHN